MSNCIACGHPIVGWDPVYSVTDDDWVCYNCGLQANSEATKRIRELETENKQFRGEYEASWVKQYRRIRKLKEALKPFAQDGFQETLGGNAQGDDSPVYGRQKSLLTLGDFRRAKSVLEEDDD